MAKRNNSKRLTFCRGCGCMMGERIVSSITFGKHYCQQCWREGLLPDATRAYLTKDEACALVGAKVGDE